MGHLADAVDEAVSRLALRDVTAIQQDAAIGLEGAAPGLQCGLVMVEIVAGEHRGAQRQFARRAVGDDLNAFEVAVVLQFSCNLLYAIGIVLQGDDFDVSSHTRNQLLRIFHFRIDKQDYSRLIYDGGMACA
ncbi:MAG TPA: hypothetical protein VIU93_12220 [Gallionellaceae bacterium]